MSIKQKLLNVIAARPKIVAAGIGIAISAVVALALSAVDNGGFSIHQAFANARSAIKSGGI
jgi:hypothetical protein